MTALLLLALVLIAWVCRALRNRRSHRRTIRLAAPWSVDRERANLRRWGESTGYRSPHERARLGLPERPGTNRRRVGAGLEALMAEERGVTRKESL
jgi:hypothetical protein